MQEISLLDAIRILRGDVKFIDLMKYLNETDKVDVQICSYFRDGMYVPSHVIFQNFTPSKLQIELDKDEILKGLKVLRIDFSPNIKFFVRPPEGNFEKYIHITVK